MVYSPANMVHSCLWSRTNEVETPQNKAQRYNTMPSRTKCHHVPLLAIMTLNDDAVYTPQRKKKKRNNTRLLLNRLFADAFQLKPSLMVQSLRTTSALFPLLTGSSARLSLAMLRCSPKLIMSRLNSSLTSSRPASPSMTLPEGAGGAAGRRR